MRLSIIESGFCKIEGMEGGPKDEYDAKWGRLPTQGLPVNPLGIY